MGYQDRQYYRDRDPMPGGPLMWLLTGSVTLFTFFGIRVRVHASLIVTIALVLLLGLGPGFYLQERLQSMIALFVIVLLHEFGHCLAARAVGGAGDEIMMTPLGGLAMVDAPRRWWPTLVTVLGGPAVNVIICAVTAAIIWSAHRFVPLDPLHFYPVDEYFSWFSLLRWSSWIYQMSWMLLVFNLLPVFPLDGGQALQAVLWRFVGYYKSMNFACITGMIGSVLMFAVAIPTSSLFLLLIAVSGFLTCRQMRLALLADGPYAYAEDDFNPGSYRESRKPSAGKIKRAQKLVQAERDERAQIDAILAKVSAQGMQSLNFLEKRALKKATENQRKRDEELSKLR